MRTGTRFIIGVISVWLVASPRMFSQERITVQAVATLTWDQIVRIDVERANRPVALRAIHSPLRGPEPREIGPRQHTKAEIPGTGDELPQRSRVMPDHTAFDLPPALSFLAIADNNTVIPPDTHGAVGISHAMTMLNSQVRIQDKLGGVTSTVSLSSFWSAVTGAKFDPKVLYDLGSSRWIAVSDADPSSTTSKVCFAMSATSDPTGTWTFYEFDADAANAAWADYPGFGVSARWVAITQNMFTLAGSFVNAKMWVIDKSSALDGPPITVTVFPTGFDVSGGVD